MKKIILFTAASCFAICAFAQKQNVQSASNSLRDKDYTKALEYIEKAQNDASTKDEPKTWFMTGRIYAEMNNDPTMKGKGYYKNAAKAFVKANELKSGYEKDAINQELRVAAYSYYNDMVTAYNAKEYDKAYDFSKGIGEIRSIEGGKKFAGDKNLDTVASQGKLFGAFSAYYNNKYAEAMPMLAELKNDPISTSENVFWLLANTYKMQNQNAQYIATIEEGRKLYPNSVNLKNEEINYYIQTGQQDVFMKKLQDAVVSDPNNGDYAFNLANGYNSMAFPKDAQGKDKPRPSNFEELVSKAESAYQSTLKIAPDNVDYNYNLGAHYFNRGTAVNDEMNIAAGSNTPAAKKKYDELEVKRNALFVQALPYLEKTVTILDTKGAKMSKDEKFNYQSSLIAMKQIYAKQDKMDKSNEAKTKFEASKKW